MDENATVPSDVEEVSSVSEAVQGTPETPATEASEGAEPGVDIEYPYPELNAEPQW